MAHIGQHPDTFVKTDSRHWVLERRLKWLLKWVTEMSVIGQHPYTFAEFDYRNGFSKWLLKCVLRCQIEHVLEIEYWIWVL